MKKLIPLFLLIFAVLLTGASCGQKYVDGGIFQSEDYGENWQQKTFVSQNGRKTVTISALDIRKIAFNPQEIITTDNGDFSKTKILYAATYTNGIYKSEDAAESWQPTSFNSGYFVDLVVNPQNPQIIYTCTDNIIYKSSDAGQTWENIYTETQSGIIMKLLINHYLPDQVYALTSVNTIIRSDDAGANWYIIYETEAYPKDAIMSPRDSRYIFVRDNDGTLYRTIDGGQNWDKPLENKDHKQLWPPVSSVSDFAFDPNNASSILISCKQGLLRSDDLGQTWYQINTLIAPEDSTNKDIKNIIVTYSKPEVIYFSIKNLIHKSDDNGQTWRILETFPSQREVKTIYVDPVNPAVLYVGTKAFEKEKNSLLP